MNRFEKCWVRDRLPLCLIQGTTILTGTNQLVDKLTAGEDKSRWINGDPAEGLNSESIVLSSRTILASYTIKHDFIRTKYVKPIIPTTEEARCRSCKLEKNHIFSKIYMLRKMSNPSIPHIMKSLRRGSSSKGKWKQSEVLSPASICSTRFS